ncbi:MAG TPA: hypothetical protein PLP29_07000 [Candidatus Ozemobacteraceae bacterium]|nr:hypothetical protein [Candidatus Ozemobacteraceae bacterium]
MKTEKSVENSQIWNASDSAVLSSPGESHRQRIKAQFSENSEHQYRIRHLPAGEEEKKFLPSKMIEKNAALKPSRRGGDDIQSRFRWASGFEGKKILLEESAFIQRFGAAPDHTLIDLDERQLRLDTTSKTGDPQMENGFACCHSIQMFDHLLTSIVDISRS